MTATATAIVAAAIAPFVKVVRIGVVPPYEGETPRPVYCKIDWDGDKLSITGVHGPKHNGDAYGSCGQIDMGLSEVPAEQWNFAPGWTAAKLAKFWQVWSDWHLNDIRAYDAEMKAAGWDELAKKPVLVYSFTLTRESYTAQDAAKKAALAALERGETFTPTAEQAKLAAMPYTVKKYVYEGMEQPAPPPGYDYARDIGGHNSGGVKPPERKTLGWLRPDEFADGLLTRKLREDGPGYGSAWFKEPVPADVLEFLQGLPASNVTPAWV